MPDRSVRVLFVCLGNICRSPLAEGIFRQLVREEGLESLFRIDSAGTSAWHIGDPPDRRTRELARERGVHVDGASRQVEAADLERFDYVIAMDRENLQDLQELRASRAGGTTRPGGSAAGAASPGTGRAGPAERTGTGRAAPAGRTDRPDDRAAELHLLREFDPFGGPDADVPDPYFGGEGGFVRVHELVERSARGLLAHIRSERGL